MIKYSNIILRGCRRSRWNSSSVASNGHGISHLPNGIRVASINSSGASVAAGILIETPLNVQVPPPPGAGASLYTLEKLAFRATRTTLTEARMQQRLDALMGAVQAKARRDYILYSGMVVPSQVKDLLTLLREVVVEGPAVREADLREEMRAVASYEADEMRNKPDELLPELSFGPAFYSPYAAPSEADAFIDYNSILGVEHELQELTVEKLLTYWKSVYLPSRMIVLGTGIPHGELYNLAEDIFGSLERSPDDDDGVVVETDNISTKTAQYQSGWRYIEKDELPLVHVAISFAGCGANEPQRAIPLAILQMLMGGGSSFSAGGPGKGMYSRLYTQVLNRHHWVESCRMFSAFSRTNGLVGIHGSALPSHAPALTETLLDQLKGMTEPLTSTELTRAKNQLRGALLMGLESRQNEIEDLGEQVAFTGTYRSPRDFCTAIESMGEEEVRAAAIDLLADSAPTVVAYGPLHRMPAYETIKKWHQNRLYGRR